MVTLSILLTVFSLGLAFGSGPCLASCGPILISYVAGTRRGFLKGLWAYVLFSIGRISVYLFLALLVFYSGNIALEELLGANFRYVMLAGGVFIILIGVLLALGKSVKFRFLNFFQAKLLERDTKSVIGLGVIAGILPCGPLIAVLSYIALVSKSWAGSIIYILIFGLGTFLSPLVLLVLLSGAIPFLTSKRAWMQRALSAVCGLVIVYLGAQLLMRAF